MWKHFLLTMYELCAKECSRKLILLLFHLVRSATDSSGRVHGKEFEVWFKAWMFLEI